MRGRLVVNPAAGSARAVDLPAVQAVFADAGWTVDCVFTQQPGDATRAAAEAVAAGYDLVIASGGDGTVNEVLQPLINRPTALSILPAGTANLLARELQLPLQPVAAARSLVAGHPFRVDAGLAGERRYFLLFAGIGFDDAVVQAVDPALKRRTGPLSFIAASVRVMPGYQGARALIRLDGRRWRRHLLMAVVANTRLFALMPLVPEARADDGQLDVVIFHGVGFWAKLRHVLAFLLGRHRTAPGVERARVRTVTIRTQPPLPVELDGEPWGSTPMTFRVGGAVTVWAPASAPADLFGQPIAHWRGHSAPQPTGASVSGQPFPAGTHLAPESADAR